MAKTAIARPAARDNKPSAPSELRAALNDANDGLSEALRFVRGIELAVFGVKITEDPEGLMALVDQHAKMLARIQDRLIEALELARGGGK